MRSVPRYPEVREDGSMWVPLAPPPAPTYRQLSPEARDIVGLRAVVSYSSEWVLDLRVFTAPYREPAEDARFVVELCEEGAWHDFERNGREPMAHERLIAATSLVFTVLDASTRTHAAGHN